MSASSTNLPVSCSRLIVCEKSGDWANLLRRTLADRGRWIVETRGFHQLAEALVDHPASLCVVDVHPGNLAAAAAAIEQLHRRRPCAAFVAASQEPLLDHGLIVREAGAVLLARSRRDVDLLSDVWRRHCRRRPPREETLREQIIAALPWPD